MKIFGNLLDHEEALQIAAKFTWGEFLPLAVASVGISSLGIGLAVYSYFLR